MKTKICNRCKKELPINMFNKDRKKKDGLSYYCKECLKKYREKNKKRIAEYMKKYKENNKNDLIKKAKEYYSKNKKQMVEKVKQYNLKNKEVKIEYMKQYTEVNKKSIAKYMTQYNQKNKDKISKQHKEYYEENKKYILKRNRKYQKKNLENCVIRAQKRLSQKHMLPHTLTVEQWTSIKNYFNNKCAYCGQEKPLTQEHFIPISKGGEYTSNNIIPACNSCNCSKRDTNFFKWYPKQKFYSKERESKILKYLNYKKGVQQLKII